MFARDYVYIDHSYEEVRAALMTPAWAAGLDLEGGSELLTRVGFYVAALPVYKRVELRLGEPRLNSTPERVVVPMGWVTSGGPPLFPEMQGDLTAEAFNDGRTQLTLNASYRPPLGALGRAIDRALLGRLADATVRDFVKRAAAAIERSIATASRPARA